MPKFNEAPNHPVNKPTGLQDDEFLIIEEDEADDLLMFEDPIEEGLVNPDSDRIQESAQSSTDISEDQTWKILIVDDEPSVHHATQIALKNFKFDGQPLEFLSAFSAEEARKVLSQFDGQVASVLLDVVMETNNAGLDLVDFIRNSLNDTQVRIILRTGQPGEAPPESVILNYDINDYQLKLDMTRQRLVTTIVAALRSYQHLQTIESQNALLVDTLEKLRASEQELKKYSHNLEVLVAERTAELRQANEQLQRLATLDGLTQVANRQCFDHCLHTYWQEASTSQISLSCLLLDVDYFKNYNDSYGHLAGDQCLRTIAQTIANSLRRPDDLVARYGGEEFAILLPKCTYEGAEQLAGDILKAIHQLKLPHIESKVSDFISISIGIACLVPHEEMQKDSLIDMADLALYQAKAQGRDQYYLYRDMAEVLPSTQI